MAEGPKQRRWAALTGVHENALNGVHENSALTGVHENGLSDLAAADSDEFSNFCSDYRSSCRFPFGDHMRHSDGELVCTDGFAILQLNGTEFRIAIITTRLNKEIVVCIVSWKATPLSAKF